MKRLSILLLCLLCLCACAPETLSDATQSPAAEPSQTVSEKPSDPESPASPPPAREENYVRELARGVIAELGANGAEDEVKILLAYRWLMENVYFADPVGLDIWRYRSGQTEPPTFEENRALSPLAFGVGSCEDFACAMVILLEEMGFEALYVPGYTISVEGDYVDHAWAVVRVGGQWYHLDPQLEQNIVRSGMTVYRFFLKSDAEMLGDHKWGENLIEYWPHISEEDARVIRERYAPPVCPASAAQRSPEPAAPPARPDIGALLQQLDDERALHGVLPKIKLNTDPPVLIPN